MKKALIMALMMAAGFAQGATETFQIGHANGDVRWDSGTAGVISWASSIDPDLVFTVTPVSNQGDTMKFSTRITCDSSARQTDLNTGRLSNDESVTVTISYVDPNGSLLGLRLDAVSMYSANSAGEVVGVTDGLNDTPGVFDGVYSNMGSIVVTSGSLNIDTLTKDNTSTWAYTADASAGPATAAGLEAMRFEYEVSSAVPPVANDDTYTLSPGVTTLEISAPGVLDNDVYAGTNTLFAQLETDVSSGSLTLNTNGSFSYDSPGEGTNTFTYKAYDIAFTSVVAATVTLITPPDIPVGSVITQTVSNIDWNLAMWGTPASAPNTNYNYITSTAGGIDSIRIGADGSASTFGGGSLTATSGIRFRIKARAGTSIVNGDLTIDGARVNLDSYSSGGTTKLQADQLIIASASTIDINGIALALELIAPLTGSGDLSVESAAGGGALPGQYVSFSEVSNYTGAITVSENMGIQFGSDITFTNGSLTILTNSALYVNSGQTLTFGSGLLSDPVNGVVPEGTYTGVDLDALGTNYVNNGGTLHIGGPVYDNTPSSSIGFEQVGSNTIMWTISLPATADPSAYFPMSTDSLVITNWTGVAHSDAPAGTYAISSLAVAGGDETNKIIYVKTTKPVEFFGTAVVE